MIQLSYASVVIIISTIWIFVRVLVYRKTKEIDWKRELQLLLVYICMIVVARFTFFPFSKVNGKIQPLVFDVARILPFRINLIPLVNLWDYEVFREAKLNIIGNTAMFIPIGVIYPIVYKELNSHKKVIAAGVGFSLVIEVLQLLFFDRVTDVDDLILNSLGYVIGYLIYLLVKMVVKYVKEKRR